MKISQYLVEGGEIIGNKTVLFLLLAGAHAALGFLRISVRQRIVGKRR